jgi:hypothetical protein
VEDNLSSAVEILGLNIPLGGRVRVGHHLLKLGKRHPKDKDELEDVIECLFF